MVIFFEFFMVFRRVNVRQAVVAVFFLPMRGHLCAIYVSPALWGPSVRYLRESSALGAICALFT